MRRALGLPACHAAAQAAECAVRMFKQGAKNHEITAMIAKACNRSSTALQPWRQTSAAV